MHRILALLPVIALVACSNSVTKSVPPPPPATMTARPSTVNIPAPNTTPIPDSAFLPPLDIAPLTCVGQLPTVQFDHIQHTTVPVTSFPLTITGSYQGCAQRVYAYYKFYPAGGGTFDLYHAVKPEVDDAGNWRYTFPTAPGAGELDFFVRAQDSSGDDSGGEDATGKPQHAKFTIVDH